MLIGRVCAGVAQDLRGFFSAQSGLNQSGGSGTAETAKTQAVRFAVWYLGLFTRGLERSFDSGVSEYRLVIAALLCLPQRFEFQTETITNRSNARLHSFGIESADIDRDLAEVAPLESKDFAGPHSGINRADQDRSQVFPASGTRSQQSRFFFEGQDADAFTFICNRDDRITFAEGTADNPSFTFRDVEYTSQGSKFAVDARDSSSLAAFGDAAQSFRLVRFKIGIRDRSESAIRKDFIDCFGVAFYRGRGAHPGDFAIIDVNGIDSVAVQVPLHHVSEARARVVVPIDVKSLPFFESFAQPVAGFSFVFPGAPEGFPPSVFHPGDAGVDVPVADYDLDFMVAGHLLPSALHVEKSGCDFECNQERDCDSSNDGNQEYLKGIDVLCCLRQDNDEEIDLTSNQKAPRSSRGECIKPSQKINLSKVRFPLNGFTTRGATRSSRFRAVP